ncbi:hypothetical protein ACA910_018172 [Epithemia clementina (nom. ined.)]
MSFTERVIYYETKSSTFESIYINVMEENPSEVIIFDGACRPPRENSRFWEVALESVVVILAAQSLREPTPTGWMHKTKQVNHTQNGGVTTARAHFHALYIHQHTDRRRICFFAYDVPQVSAGRLYDLVNKTLSGRRVSKHDIAEQPQQVETQQLLDPGFQFTLPTVYTQNKCIRSLTPSEMALGMDIPATLSQPWNDDMKRVVVKRITLPVKMADIMSHYLRKFLNQTACVKPSSSSKRTSSDLQGDRPKRQRLANTEPTSGPEDEKSWTHQGRIRLANFSLSNYKFDSTAAEKAVKDNKAEVPIQIWDYRAAFLLDVKELLSTQMRALDLLRRLSLRRWKRNVVRSWSTW